MENFFIIRIKSVQVCDFFWLSVIPQGLYLAEAEDLGVRGVLTSCWLPPEEVTFVESSWSLRATNSTTTSCPEL